MVGEGMPSRATTSSDAQSIFQIGHSDPDWRSRSAMRSPGAMSIWGGDFRYGEEARSVSRRRAALRVCIATDSITFFSSAASWAEQDRAGPECVRALFRTSGTLTLNSSTTIAPDIPIKVLNVALAV